MKEKIKPCPCNGKKPTVDYTEDGELVIYCKDCGREFCGEHGETIKDMIHVWNDSIESDNKKEEKEEKQKKEKIVLGQTALDFVLKNNNDLMEKLETAKEALRFYASGQHIDAASIGSSYAIRMEDGTVATKALKDIENG